MKKLLSIILTIVMLVMPMAEISAFAVPTKSQSASASPQLFDETDVYVYTEANTSQLSPGEEFTYDIYFSGTYDGYSIEVPKNSGDIIVTGVDSYDECYLDETEDCFMLSVPFGLCREYTDKIMIATVYAVVADDATTGDKELTLQNLAFSTEMGELASHYLDSSTVYVYVESVDDGTTNDGTTDDGTTDDGSTGDGSTGDGSTNGDGNVDYNAVSYVYTETNAGDVEAGKSFEYFIYLAGTYDGYSIIVPKYSDCFTITKVVGYDGCDVSVLEDSYMFSVLYGKNRENSDKTLVAIVTVDVDSTAAEGTYTLPILDVLVSDANGEPATVEAYYSDIQVNEAETVIIPDGDINDNGTFDYYDISKLYAIYRGKASGDDTDINIDNKFDYFDIAKLYAIYRSKASFGSESVESNDTACVYTIPSAYTVEVGDEFTYGIYLSGTYDGYSFDVPKENNGMVITGISANDSCYIDDMGTYYLVSVLGGKGREYTDKILIATVTAKFEEVYVTDISVKNIQISDNCGNRVSYSTYFESVDVIPLAVPVTSVSLSESSLILEKGDTHTLTATVYPENADNQNIYWSTSNSSVATVLDGVVTAVGKGTATITVKTSDGAKTATCRVTVTAPDAFIFTEPSKSTVRRGEEFTFDVYLSGTYDGYSFDILKSFDGITVTKVLGKDAMVDNLSDRYMVSVLGGKGRVDSDKKLIATATATVDLDAAVETKTLFAENIMLASEDGMPASCVNYFGEIEIDPAVAVQSVFLNHSSASLKVGEGISLVASVYPDLATNKAVFWHSSNSSVVTVDENGIALAVMPGNATVTVTTEDGSKTATCDITVKPYDAVISTTTSTSAAYRYPNYLLAFKFDVVLSGTYNGYSFEIPKATDELKVYSVIANDAKCNVDDMGDYYLVSTMWGLERYQTEAQAVVTVTAVPVYNAPLGFINICPENVEISDEYGEVAYYDTKYCTIEIKEPVRVEAISLDKTQAFLKPGENTQLTATVEPYDATVKYVYWYTTNIDVAEVDENGLVKAKSAGTTTITAVTADGNLAATCLVEVAVPVTHVVINEDVPILNVGESFTLTATVYPENATNKNVTWSSSDENVVSVENGLVKAVGSGSAEISVVTEDGNKTATTKITVVTRVERVSLNTTSASLVVGETLALEATVYPHNATNKNITWSTTNAAVATVENGDVLAVGAGSAEISVITEDGQKTDICYVTVRVPVTSVSLDVSTKTLVLGESFSLTATVYPENATNKNVIWLSSDENVVSVENGVVTALSAGTAKVSVITEDGNKTSECIVTVIVPVESVSIATAIPLLEVGDDPIELEALVYPLNATNKNVTWHTSNPEIVSLDGSYITALTPGTSTITVTTEDGEKTASVLVTVDDYDAFVYTKAKSKITRGKQFSFNVTIKGTYDGYAFNVPKNMPSLEIIDYEIVDDGVNVDENDDAYLVSVLGGKAKVNSDEITIVTFTAKYDPETEPGINEIYLTEVMITGENGERASRLCEYASVEVTNRLDGDINGDDKFDYFDVSKLYAYFRGKTTLDDGAEPDVNGDGKFDYYDVSKLYAVFRGKATL